MIACFFSPMHPLSNPLPEASDVSTGVPKMVPCEHSARPDLDAVCTFVLKIAQDEILPNRQLCDYSVEHHADRSIGKGVKFSNNSSARDILLDKRPPQVTEVTRTKDTVQPYIEAARGDPMHSYVEPAR